MTINTSFIGSREAAATKDLQAALNSKYTSWEQNRNLFHVPFLEKEATIEGLKNSLGASAKQNAAESLYPVIEGFLGDIIKGDLQPIPTIFDDFRAMGMLSAAPITQLFVERANYDGDFAVTTGMWGEGTRYSRGDVSFTAVPHLVSTAGTGENFRDEASKLKNDNFLAKEDLMRTRDRNLLRGVKGSYKTKTGVSAEMQGLTTADGLNSVTWNHNGENIYAELQKLVKPLRNLSITEKLMLYVSHNFTEALEDDYKEFGSLSLMARVKQNERISNIKALEGLEDHEAIVIPMSRKYCDIATAIPYAFIPVPNSNDGTSMSFKHLTSYALRVFQFGKDGKTGIVYGTSV